MLNFHYQKINKKVNNPIKSWTKNFDKHFSKEDTHMEKGKKHLKDARCH